MSLSPVGPQSPEVSMPSIRMKLDNAFASMQEDGKSSNMKVFARVRPMLPREEKNGYQECVGVMDNQVVRAIIPNSSAKHKSAQAGHEIYEDFTYTQAFGPEIGQFVFFRQSVLDIMQGFIEGQNCLVFSYGITNSGKTFTLQGDESNPGIIPLAMRLFFASIKHQLLEGISAKPDKFADILLLTDKETDYEVHMKEQLMQTSEKESIDKTNSTTSLKKSFSSNWCECFDDDFEFKSETTLPPDEMIAAQSALYMKELSKKSADQQEGLCSIWISFVEIYNEYIYDLLQPNVLNRAKLSLGEDQNGDVYVKGAREICVSSSEEALKLLNFGRRNLRIAATKLNYQSSRSHCIYTVKVVRMFDQDNGRVNRISFCDLAGSERAAKSQTTGVHLKEAGYINTSILVLGKCLEQLRLNQSLRDRKMIPLRESKLTRLFSGHFLGKGRAVMIANVSPCEYTFDETLNVLRFSALLKTVKFNDSYLSTVSSSLQNITNITRKWSESKAETSVFSDDSDDLGTSFQDDLKDREDMINELLDLADTLRNKLEKEKREKIELEAKIRQEVCTENAEYSDQLLENQRRISNDYIESIKELHAKRVAILEERHEKRVAELLAQLQEYEQEDTTDESSMSINKENFSMNTEDAESSKIIFASPGSSRKSCLKKKFSFSSPVPVVNAEMESSTTVSLLTQTDSRLEEIKLLQEKLELITKELEVTQEQLKSNTEMLTAAQNEATSACEECQSFKLKLQIAEAALDDSKTDLESCKSQLLEKDAIIENLNKENEISVENMLALDKKLGVAALEIEQLKNDKIKNDDECAQLIKELQSKICCMEEQCKTLNHKLEESFKSLSEVLEENSHLKSQCKTLNTDKNTSKMEIKELEEKISTTLIQLASADSKCQVLAKNLEAIDDVVNTQRAQIDDLVKENDSLNEANAELSSSYKLEKEIVAELVGKEENKNSEISKLKLDCVDYQTKYEEILTSTQKLEEKCTMLSEQFALKDSCPEVDSQIESTRQQLEDQKLENSVLQTKCSDLSSQLENALRDQEEKMLKLSNLEKEIEDLNVHLGIANKAVSELKLKIDSLESECSLHKNNHAELLEEYKILKEKLSNDKGNLEKMQDDLKTKQADLKSECEKHKSNYEEVCENFKNLEVAFTSLTKDYGCLKAEHEKIKQEKITEVDFQNKSVEELKESISEKERKNKELIICVQNLENSVQECTTKEKEFEACKLENTNLQKELKITGQKHKDLIKEMSAKSEEYSTIITDLEKCISEQESRIEENSKTLESYKSETLSKDAKIISCEEEIVNLNAELEKATMLCDQSDELQGLSHKNEELSKKNEELAKYISDYEIKIKELTESVQAIETCKADIQNKEIEIASCKEEVEYLNAELQKAKLLQEQSDLLCASLQKCELVASNKIKLMHSCAIQHKEEISDMRRQIKEKNASIEQLEIALCDSQKQMREMDAKIEKQIEEKRQDASHIEQILHEKKLMENENHKLKNSLKEANITESKNEEKEVPNEVKGRKKRSLSDVNKEVENEENDKKELKENSKKTNKIQDKKPTKSVKEVAKVKEEKPEEKEAGSKRRRILRVQQPKAVDSDATLESESDEEEEYKPTKNTVARKKKPVAKAAEPPKQRTSRRKLQEQENASPVKKAMQYVGSKIRSVAQTVSSPRITRGRKKLFNADAAPKATEARWRP